MDRRDHQSYFIGLAGVATSVAAVFLGITIGRIVEDAGTMLRPIKSLISIDTNASWINPTITVSFFVGAICIMYFTTQCVRSLATNYAECLINKAPLKVPQKPIWLALASYIFCYSLVPYLAAGILPTANFIGLGIWGGWYLILVLGLTKFELWPLDDG